MQAMVLTAPHKPLEKREIHAGALGPHDVRVRVRACGVCRTDSHVLDGDLSAPKLPLILGHEIVGEVEELGSEATAFRIGERIGVPWLARTCLQCQFWLNGQETLCDFAEFTGYTTDGGYTETAVTDSRFCFPIPESFSTVEAAPLLCAGLIGWRTLKFAGTGYHIHWIRRTKRSKTLGEERCTEQPCW